MGALVDTHVHLLAGRDDGPASRADALEMCRILVREGVGTAAALAHQSEFYPDNTPAELRLAVAALKDELKAENVPLQVVPCAEVMLQPDFVAAWERGDFLSMGDRKLFVLVEMPHQFFVNLRPIAPQMAKLGVRLLLAHAERHPEFLHNPGLIEDLIRLGCIVQVSSHSITHPLCPEDEQALKSWAKRGIIHVLGTDGHGPVRRPPLLAAAYAKLRHWTSVGYAERVGSTHGLAVLHGLPLKVPPPEPPARKWFAWWS
jgi:protein-tyrosine phosphatase